MKALIPIAMLLLTGCGASEVMQAGPSTFSVSAQEGLLTGGWGAAQKEALAKANQHCSSLGQHFSLIDEKQSGLPGYTPLNSTITFACGPDVAAEAQSIEAHCADEMQAPELAPLQAKVELVHKSPDTPPPFEFVSNETFPTPADRPLIAEWAKMRDRCLGEQIGLPLPAGASALNATIIQQDRAFGSEAAGRVGDLILALYNGKLTFGEFAQKRYEIGRDGAAAERQFRAATLIADHERQAEAQQAAQQQFQNNLIAWSAYMQAVNARLPQTVHCSSVRVGALTNTNCT